MAEQSEKLRNIALVAHSGAGKTSLAEYMLFKAGVTTRIGRVEDGNTAMDFEPEELKRQSSISSGIHQFEWSKHTVNVIDTPGDQNFLSDTQSCMRAADTALVVIDAIDGIKVQTEQTWAFASTFDMPCILFVNKLDKERAQLDSIIQDAAVSLEDPKPIALQLPIGSEEEFKGVVDLIRKKAFFYDEEGKSTEGDVPPDMTDQVDAEYETLVENIAEADDALVERYLEGEELTEDDLKKALKKGLRERLCAGALRVGCW